MKEQSDDIPQETDNNLTSWEIENVPVNYTKTETIQVEQTVETHITTATVKLRGINIDILPNQKIILFVDWAWLNENKEVIRRGVRRFTHEEVEQMLESKGASLTELQQLFLTMTEEDAQTPTTTE